MQEAVESSLTKKSNNKTAKPPHQEPAYKRACAYLDEDAGAGWTLFQDMANPDRLLAAAGGDVYALGDRLLDSPFLR